MSDVVLIHGFLEDRSMWDDFSAYLRQVEPGWRIFRYDLPGHGEAPSLDGEHTMEAMAQIIHEQMQRDGVKAPLWIGHSMGGYVGLAYAELYPGNLGGLCLFHSTAHADTDNKKAERVKAADLVLRSPRPFIEMAIHNLFAPYNQSRMKASIEAAIQLALNMSPEAIAKTLLGMRLRPDRIDVLERTPHAAIIGGVDDPVIPYARECATYEQRAVSIRWLEHCGHMGHLERREEAFNALLDWCRTASTQEP